MSLQFTQHEKLCMKFLTYIKYEVLVFWNAILRNLVKDMTFWRNPLSQSPTCPFTCFSKENEMTVNSELRSTVKSA